MSVKQGYNVEGKENCTAKEYLEACVEGKVDQGDLEHAVRWAKGLGSMCRPLCGEKVFSFLLKQGYV